MININRLAVISLILTISILPPACLPSPVVPQPISAPSLVPSLTPTPSPTRTATAIETPTPTVTLTSVTSYTVVAGDSLWSISRAFGVPMEHIAGKNGLLDPNQIFVGQVLLIPDPSEKLPTITPSMDGKWIEVVLSEQKAYAFEGSRLIRDFLVSTGVPEHPTVTGTFYIYIKLESTTMSGEGYYLTNVPWTMYFYQGYSFHGTYWHNNFGQPMSHGCVNMYTPDAEWLFLWAAVGTKVVVIP